MWQATVGISAISSFSYSFSTKMTETEQLEQVEKQRLLNPQNKRLLLDEKQTD